MTVIDTPAETEGSAFVPITMEELLIGPDQAAELLEANTHNRTIRTGTVEEYVNDMKAERWRQAGEPIKVSKSGKLLDGQHRLWAVIISGKTIPFIIIRGLDDEAQSVMDSGIKRTAHDVLHLKGVSNATSVAALARMIILWDRGDFNTSKTESRVGNASVEAWLDANPHAEDIVNKVLTYRPLIIRGQVLTTVFYLTSKVDPVAAEVFLEKLTKGYALEEGDPIAALRSRFIQIRTKRQDVKTTTLIAVTLRCWNAWRKGKTQSSFLLYDKAGKPVLAPDELY